MERLEELGLLEPGDNHDSPENERERERERGGEKMTMGKQIELFRRARGARHRGAPWFEELVEDSRLGRVRRQKGGHTSEDGSASVEWEIIEWTNDTDEEDGATPSKRKHAALEVEAEDRMDVGK